MSTDWEWLSFILVNDVALVIGAPLVIAAGVTGAGSSELTAASYLLGLFTFGIGGGGGWISTLISAYFFIINGMGGYLIAKMVRGN